MKDFLDKISSYNLFNFLLPGALFAILAEKITSYAFLQSDLIIAFFTYYFIGLVISRFGSLIIQPILTKLSLVKFASYEEYLKVSKKDEKLDTLSEINNTYRSLLSMMVLLIFLKAYEFLEASLPILKTFNIYILIAGLSIIFLFSYIKQTDYINQRVKARR